MSFDLYGINEKLLNQLSYESKLGKSLKNTLRKFDKEGSLVLEAEQGQRVASLSRYLTLTTLE